MKFSNCIFFTFSMVLKIRDNQYSIIDGGKAFGAKLAPTRYHFATL